MTRSKKKEKREGEEKRDRSLPEAVLRSSAFVGGWAGASPMGRVSRERRVGSTVVAALGGRLFFLGFFFLASFFFTTSHHTTLRRTEDGETGSLCTCLLIMTARCLLRVMFENSPGCLD